MFRVEYAQAASSLDPATPWRQAHAGEVAGHYSSGLSDNCLIHNSEACTDFPGDHSGIHIDSALGLLKILAVVADMSLPASDHATSDRTELLAASTKSANR